MPYATTNPYTGEAVKTFPTASDEQVTAAIDAAFASWKKTPVAERTRVLRQCRADPA